jgi:Penicillin-insensitive murein endopeptidase
VRRALQSLGAALLVTGLLAAGVLAAPHSDTSESRSGKSAGPFALMRDRPVELEPRLQDFQAPEPEPDQVHQPATPAPPLEPIDTLAPNLPERPSRALGQPWNGRLKNGVQVPANGVAFFTFDSALRRSPSRGWRRWGTDVNVTHTLAVIREFHAAHPDAPRLGIGDLSRPRGGHFGREFGGVGHASHQNGLDADIYYPRRDRLEKPPSKVSQVDRALAQDLVDRFVAAGAQICFVGPNVGLHGPRGRVQKLVGHDDHVHVRWPTG